MRPMCKCHGEAMRKAGASGWRCVVKTRTVQGRYDVTAKGKARHRRYDDTAKGEARQKRHEARRVYVHGGPGGRITMPSTDQAAQGRAFVAAERVKLAARFEAEREALRADLAA